MHFRPLFKILGIFIGFLSLMFIPPLAVSVIYADGHASIFGLSFIITLTMGTIGYLPNRHIGREINHRESFVLVSACWVLAGCIGSIPFLMSHTFGGVTYIERVANAFFEAVSGLTTTGASVITEIESLSPSILFFRSMIHWLGGMGIILLSLAIFPLLGIGGMELFKAEVPGPVTDKLMPRIQDTAKILWIVYLVISLSEVCLLKLSGMGWFDSICHMFGTMATGGFSTKNNSIAYFGNVSTQLVLIFYMVVAGTNFSLHYQLFRGRYRAYLADEEFRFYCKILVGATVILTASLMFTKTYTDVLTAIKDSLFQVVSITTTTGFVTADYEKWPFFCQALIVAVMFWGGCTGSTGGGIKMMRLLILFKLAYHELLKNIHPHAVIPVKINGKTVSEGVVQSINGFFCLYVFSLLFFTLLMTATGLDLVSAFTSVVATIGNIGPAFGIVGPMDNYASISAVGKGILSICMIMGRLELYTFVLLVCPALWKK